MRIVALYGTESGNAEDVAIGIAKAMPDLRIEVMNMADASPAVFDPGTLYFIACATHGGGELPGFAQFLHDDLADLTPDLSGVTYAMFGLGDSSYEERYLRGAKQFDELLSSLGATRVGPFGEHDVMARTDPAETGVAWAADVLVDLRS